jgi:hypothetical protein
VHPVSFHFFGWAAPIPIIVFLFSTFFRPRRTGVQPSGEENAVFIETLQSRRRPDRGNPHIRKIPTTFCHSLFTKSAHLIPAFLLTKAKESFII